MGFSGSLDWAAVQPEMGEVTRVCSYDRAGIMWSESGPGPRDAHRIADELHSLLRAGGEAPPYILVGHSLGGLFNRVYDARYPGEVVGFVFVDSSHPEQMDRTPEELVDLMTPPSLPTALVGSLSALGVVRLMDVVPVDFLPMEARPAAAAHGSRSLIGANGEILSLGVSASQAGMTGELGARPTVVLSATNRSPPPGFEVSEAAQSELVSVMNELQDEIAQLSTNSWHRLIESTHYIQIEAPEAVIAAVRDVVAAVREEGLASRDETTRGEG